MGIVKKLGLLICGAAIASIGWLGSYVAAQDSANEHKVQSMQFQVAESVDFATQVLRDPWDMSEYSDISQHINDSGHADTLRNISVENGVFSAHSTDKPGAGDANFFALFPGYPDSLPIGQTGAAYPIDATQYRCLYVAMKVESGSPSNGQGYDFWWAFWFADATRSAGNSPWGQGAAQLYPEAGTEPPVHRWELYRMDLEAPPRPYPGDAWSSQPLWRGLRIDPTLHSGVNFAVDWVRLTDCTPQATTITWAPNREISALWLKPVGADYYIRTAVGLDESSGSYALDIQGVQAGEYAIGLGTELECCIDESNATLTVTAAPVVNFIRPSVTSGADYATTAGNTWDFADEADVVRVANMTATVHDGVLDMNSPSGPLPAGADAQFQLNGPVAADPAQYRYLTVRMYTEWDSPWQDVGSGSITRWIWGIPSVNGEPGAQCYLVTQDIVLDVGWHTYTVDLHDYYQGSPEDYGPRSARCPSPTHSLKNPPVEVATNPIHWLNTKPVNTFRFDPNENITCDFVEPPGSPEVPCSTYRQQIDWIALTAVDQVEQGVPYEIVMDLNKQMSASDVTLYYTTNIAQPHQNRALSYTIPSTPGTPAGRFRSYLPVAARPPQNAGANDFIQAQIPLTYNWDTQPVAPGEYYICVEANDSLTIRTYCSQTPVQVQ